MARSTPPKRFTVSLDVGDYEALRKLAESQRPLLLQYVVRLTGRRFLDQPQVTLLRPVGDEQL